MYVRSKSYPQHCVLILSILITVWSATLMTAHPCQLQCWWAASSVTHATVALLCLETREPGVLRVATGHLLPQSVFKDKVHTHYVV